MTKKSCSVRQLVRELSQLTRRALAVQSGLWRKGSNLYGYFTPRWSKRDTALLQRGDVGDDVLRREAEVRDGVAAFFRRFHRRFAVPGRARPEHHPAFGQNCAAQKPLRCGGLRGNGARGFR